MFLRNKKNFLMISSLLLSLSGCASYTSSMLTPLSESLALKAPSDQNVIVSWKFFEKSDCETYLGRNVLAEGYVPAQVTIRNYSTDPMYLEANNFNIPLSPVNEVANSVHTSTAGRALGWGIPGLFIWPLLIPAVYDGILSENANASLDADYHSKAINYHTIQPHTTFSGVVFIPQGKMNQSINMFLVNQRTSEKIVFSSAESIN